MVGAAPPTSVAFVAQTTDARDRGVHHGDPADEHQPDRPGGTKVNDRGILRTTTVGGHRLAVV